MRGREMKLEIGNRYQSIVSRDIRKILFLNDEVVFYKTESTGQYHYGTPIGFISNHKEYRDAATVKKIIEGKNTKIVKDDQEVYFIGVHFEGNAVIDLEGGTWIDEDLKGWWLV
jgi:hypothetical protein